MGPTPRTVLAEVVWSHLPVSVYNTFCRPCHLSDGGGPRSLVVEPNGSFVNVSFLVPSAPHYLLVAGTEFEVYDGPNKILIGRVIA